MRSNVDIQSKKSYDWLKWFVAIVLIIAGLVANHHYNSQPWPLRMLGWLLLLVLTAAILLQTQLGAQALSFARESRLELRKVFWPTRQETIQTTFFIVIVVISLALVLWGVDTILMWLIGWLTGQRG